MDPGFRRDDVYSFAGMTCTHVRRDDVYSLARGDGVYSRFRRNDVYSRVALAAPPATKKLLDSFYISIIVEL